MEKDPIDVGLTIMQQISKYGVVNWLWFLLISVWAGTAKYLSDLNGSTPTLQGWFIDAVISGFVGMIAVMACQYMELSLPLTGVLTGVFAHNGTRSLYIIRNILRKPW